MNTAVEPATIDISAEMWQSAMSASNETRQTVADWARIQFPTRDLADIEYDILVGLRIAIEKNVPFERAMRYAVVRGVIISPDSSLYFN